MIDRPLPFTATAPVTLPVTLLPILLATLLALLVAGTARAQEPAAAAEPDAGGWEFNFSAYQYFVQGAGDYLQPTLQADRGALHLEARFNYEDRDTASAWLGWNFSLGGELSWDVTPMVGIVFGDTDGIAPGYHTTLSWWRLEAYSEGEYVIDFDSSDDNYFYTWSEFTIAPADWLRAGMVVQRTRVYDTDLDVQRGLLLGASLGRFDVTACWFNPDESDSVVVLGVGVGF